MNTPFDTDRIYFEPIEQSWAQEIWDANTGNVKQYFYNFSSLEEVREWVNRAIEETAQGKYEYIVVSKETDQMIGMVSPRIIDACSADIGMWIGERYQNKGYGNEALKQVIDWLFDVKHIERVYYKTDRANLPSQWLARSIGMMQTTSDLTDQSEVRFMASR